MPTGARTDLLITLPNGTTTVPTNADDVRTTITNWLHTIPAAARHQPPTPAQ